MRLNKSRRHVNVDRLILKATSKCKGNSKPLWYEFIAFFYSLFAYLLGHSIQQEVQSECLFSLQPFPWVGSHSHRHCDVGRNANLYRILKKIIINSVFKGKSYSELLLGSESLTYHRAYHTRNVSRPTIQNAGPHR